MAQSEFGKAFAAARKSGQKSFMFQGKSYHTRTKEEDQVKNMTAEVGKRVTQKLGNPLTPKPVKVTAQRKDTSTGLTADLGRRISNKLGDPGASRQVAAPTHTDNRPRKAGRSTAVSDRGSRGRAPSLTRT